jgi:hypothetical protein
MRSVHQKSNDAAAGNEQARLRPAEAQDLEPLGDLQQAVGNRGMLHLLGGIALQSKLKTSQPSDPHEQEADRAAAHFAGHHAGAVIQPKCEACATGAPCSECAEEETEPELQLKPVHGMMIQAAPATGATPSTNTAEPAAAAEKPTAKKSAAASLIVEDDAQDLAPGQMRKSEFLSQLRTSVCSAAEAELAGTMWSAMGCPYIERWLGHYSKQPSAYLERALRKYAPETTSVHGARDYIPLVTQRVRRGIQEWRSTGEVKDLPAEFSAGGMPGMTVSGLVGGLLSGVGSAISGLVSGAGRAIGGAISSVGRMLFKHRENSSEDGSEQDPEQIRGQLGSGRALDSSVQRRMQSAFGVNFAGVRVHTDARARELNEGLQARAFTIGNDIAFGAEEYQPGTPVGDALIAHELAHVVQQGSGKPSSGPMQKGSSHNDHLEEDADLSAVHAVVSTWTDAKDGLAGIGRNAIPRLRSGLRLQRCSKSQREIETERLGNLQHGFMEQKRKEEQEKKKKEAEEEAKKKGLPPPKTEPKYDLGDLVKDQTKEHALKGSPTKEWDEADQPAWKKRADAAWKAVVASVKGTELESIVKDVKFNFDPKAALEGGFYASQNGHTLTVGMSWVRFAEKDPKNAWENLAHEMGGHLKYGVTYLNEIMDVALSKLSSADRKRIKGETKEEKQKFFETYEYPETEIYASLWQRRYRVPETGKAPESGGIHPDENIVKRLKVMQDVLHPEVALAVLKELKRRVDENDQILKRDKDFYVAKVKEVFGYDL